MAAAAEGTEGAPGAERRVREIFVPTKLGAELATLGEGASLEDVARAAVESIYALRDEGRPAFALVRAFRLCNCERFEAALLARHGIEGEARCLALIASRGDLPRWNDVEGELRLLPLSTSSNRAPFAAEIARRLALPEAAQRGVTFHVADPRESPFILGRDLVAAHDVSAVIGIGADAADEEALIVVAFARGDVTTAGRRAFELFGTRVAKALLDTREVVHGVSATVRHEARIALLERTVRVLEAQTEEIAAETRREMDAHAEEAAREVARREADLVAHNERLRRTQRAMLNVIEDLREARATLEARVQERTRRVYEILEETQDSFFALDRDFKFVMMNRRHEEMLGVSRADSLGKGYFDLFPADETSKFRTEYRRVRDARVPASFVEWLASRRLWVEVSATPSSDGGIAVFYRDITRRVALERERDVLLGNEHRARIEAEGARAQAESANRMKDQFLATVSHELRTPLNAILGWAQMLRGDRLPPEKRGTALETIERNARVQVRLVEDLLDLGRILQGKFQLAVGPVEMVRVVEAALASLAPAAEAKGVRLQRTLDSHATIVGDAERLQQIVWNLVSNAIKFTPRGGRVHVTLTRSTSYVELAVADTGDGIDAGFLPHVFEPFRQADGAISRRAGGLGLGLSIVRSLVELHGGTVVAASDGRGGGATFTVRIPVAPVRLTPSEAQSSVPGDRHPSDVERPQALAGLRVLVVDDEPDTRELVAFVLAQCRAEVTSAASAAEATSKLGEGAFDVLVSDVGMPDEDGLAMIRRIRERPDCGRIPAVALTAYARSEDRANAIRAGFDAHLAKPVDATELALVVAALVRKHR